MANFDYDIHYAPKEQQGLAVGLERQRTNLELALANTNNAITALDANPGYEVFMQALQKAGV
jgi:hypothetical protein